MIPNLERQRWTRLEARGNVFQLKPESNALRHDHELEQAALELYGERGFEQTTIVEIAARACLTERTFFRHFADKRKVIFGARALCRNCW